MIFYDTAREGVKTTMAATLEQVRQLAETNNLFGFFLTLTVTFAGGMVTGLILGAWTK